MLGDKACMQSAFQFPLKVLDGFVIRSLCRQVMFFSNKTIIYGPKVHKNMWQGYPPMFDHIVCIYQLSIVSQKCRIKISNSTTHISLALQSNIVILAKDQITVQYIVLVVTIRQTLMHPCSNRKHQ